jgi:hypothetical protein
VRALAQGTIDNPIINSPFVEPARHFLTQPDGHDHRRDRRSAAAGEIFVLAEPGRQEEGMLLR